MKARPNFVLYAFLAAIAFGGCERPRSEEASKPEKKSEPPAVAQTAELKTAEGSKSLNGVATLLNPDALLQIDADLRAATISAGFSSGTAGRYKSAASLSRQSIENAQRQASTDATQVKLLEMRLQQTWGDDAPFLDAASREKLITALSAGTQSLVRLDFPNLNNELPRNVRIAPLSGGDGALVKTLWVAPSGNQSMPGVSYFGVIDAGPGLRPGDRARLMADGTQTSSGVIIPNSAIVIFAGESWCFVETAPKKFERRAVSLELPVADGYLVTSGFKAGTRVVVRGASLLLAREADPGDADDDDDGAHNPSAPAKDQKPGDADDKASQKPAEVPDKNATDGATVAPAKSGQSESSDAAQRRTKAASSNDKDPD